MTEVTIRRATPDDAADVATMVREIAAHEGQAAQVHLPTSSGAPCSHASR